MKYSKRMLLLTKIDQFLNAITMYRLVLYGLFLLALVAVLFGFLGWLPFSGLAFVTLLLTVLVSSTAAHFISLKIWQPIANSESFLITALILFFILAPSTDPTDLLVAAAAGTISISSRYVFAIGNKHIFNPAAIAVVVLGLLGFGNAIWWVGSATLLPFVLLLGVLIVRKIRKFYLFWTFLFSALITISLFNFWRFEIPIITSLVQTFLSWPIIFLGTVMLTEPLTAPARKKPALVFAGIVGILFGSQFELGPLFSSPELALVVGNLISFAYQPPQQLQLQLLDRKWIGKNMIALIFNKPDNFTFQPGQYLEWTVPPVYSDSRGNRRYFTIASAPTESTLQLGVKIPPQRSKFKHALQEMPLQSKIVAHQLAGDFILPPATNIKIGMIAGGIGITPFRSMAQFAIDTQEIRDVQLLYACSDPEEMVYQDIFNNATKLGWNWLPIITRPETTPKEWSGEVGRISEAMLHKRVPDYQQRTWYLSGPNEMVQTYQLLLISLGVPRVRIHTDYFPGF